MHITELEDDQEGEQHSLGEEGGCRSNGGDELNDAADIADDHQEGFDLHPGVGHPDTSSAFQPQQ